MKNNKKTLVIIKPVAVGNKNIGEIISIFEKHPDLSINYIKTISLTQSQARDFYQEYKDKAFFLDLIDNITSGLVVAMIIEGYNAIKEVRQLCGSTDPKRADHGTIRYLFGKDIGKNAVHSSDSEKAFEREFKSIFGILI